MGGGLLNIVAYGNQNVILNGNPSKTFFKTTYAKYTNFGLQKFRLDFQGQKTLRENRVSIYNFTISRYADLLMDTYFVIDFPNIWSPIYMPSLVPSIDGLPYCQPYEFKWIENLGAQLIKKITLSVGGHILQEYSGQYLYNMVKRDFTKVKQDLFDEMTGNVPQMNDPANYANNNGNYPSALRFNTSSEPSIRARTLYIPLNLWYMLSTAHAFPLLCVGENQLRITIECRPIRELFVVRDMEYYTRTYWCVKTALGPGSECLEPLIDNTGSANYTLPPTPNDISYAGVPYISTMNRVDPRYQMYLFLTQQASDVYSSIIAAGVAFDQNAQSNWYADPHLMCTYAFLDEPERLVFRSQPQTYLLRDVHEYTMLSASHRQYEKTRFSSAGLVANWMWFFQRDDVQYRNEWSNYTNWMYKNRLPFPVTDMYYTKVTGDGELFPLGTANPNPNPPQPFLSPCRMPCSPYLWDPGFGGRTYSHTGIPALGATTWGYNMTRYPPYFPYIYTSSDISGIGSGVYPKITGPYHNSGIGCATETANDKYIMKTWSLWCDGKLRENTLDAGVLDNVEKYARASGGANEACYFYNFGLTTNPEDAQPTGAMNLILFKDIDFEYATIQPPIDVSAQQLTVCYSGIDDPSDTTNPGGSLLGINSPSWVPYQYNYNLHIMEERYNLLTFDKGLVWLKFTHHR